MVATIAVLVAVLAAGVILFNLTTYYSNPVSADPDALVRISHTRIRLHNSPYGLRMPRRCPQPPLRFTSNQRPAATRVVTQGGTVKVYVTAVPEKGRANKAVVEVVARRLGVPKGTVSIVSGEWSRMKLLAIEDLSEVKVRRRLGE